jgi:integrase
VCSSDLEYGRPRWLKVGNFPIMTLEQAREQARGLLRQADLKKDPAKEKKDKKKAKTIADVCDWYLDNGVSHKKPSTIATDKGRIETLIKPLIGSEHVAALSRGQVISFMRDIIIGDKIRKLEKSGKLRGLRRVSGGEGAAVRTIQLLGAILEFAKQNELIKDNPAHGIKKPKSKVKDIFLTLDEIYALGRVLMRPEWQTLRKMETDIIKLILLTGCRKSEVLGLRWEYVDWANQVFRFPDTKTGKQNRPFGVGAMHLLREIQSRQNNGAGGWVFPSTSGRGHLADLLRTFKQMCQTLDDEGQRILNKDNTTIHALRHTFASLGADMGYSDIVLAALLGHTLGTITNRYTHSVDKTLIQVADNISLKIESALAGKSQSAKVINIAKRA